jgi:hypothetical protein
MKKTCKAEEDTQCAQAGSQRKDPALSGER